MPRPKKDFIRLTGRVIAEGGSTQEEVNFVRRKLKIMDQASLIRQAISIYYKYETGQLFSSIIDQKMEEIVTRLITTLKSMNPEDVQEILKKEEAVTEEKKLDEFSPKEKELLNKIKRDLSFGFGMLKDD